MPTPDEVELLSLPPNVPVIRQFRVATSTAGRPVETTVMLMGAYRYELHYKQAITP